MGSTDVLRILTAVDVGPLQAGMSQAAATVQAATDKMGASFKQLQGASALWLPRDMATELNAQRDNAVAAVESIGTHSASSAAEARHAIRGLGEEIGITMPRFVSNFLTSIGPVSSVMAMAFTPIAIIGVIEVLKQVPDVIQSGINKLRGWDEEAKKKWEEEADAALRMSNAVAESHLKINRSLSTIGLSGLERNKAEQKSLDDEIHELENRKGDLQEQLNQAEKTKAELGSGWFTKMMHGKELDQATHDIQTFKTQIEELKLKLIDLSTGHVLLPAEAKDEAATQANEVAAARIEADKTVAMAHVAAIKAQAENDYRMGLISLAQLTAALEKAEDDKFKIMQKSIDRQKALEASKSATGENAAPKMATLDASAKALKEEHEEALLTIHANYAEQTKRVDEQLALARIDGEQKVGTEIVNRDEQTAKQQYELHQITAAQETALLIDAENRRDEIEKNAIEKRIKVAEQEPEKNKVLIENLNNELLVLDQQYQTKKQSIQSAGDAKILADEQARYATEIAYAMRAADEELKDNAAMDDKKLSSHRMKSEAWYKDEITVLDKWHAKANEILNSELMHAELIYKKDSKEYEAVILKKEHLDQQYAQKKKALDDKMQQENTKFYNKLEQSLSFYNNQMLSTMKGQQTATQMMENMWAHLADQMVMSIMKGIEAEIAASITRKAIDKESIIGKAGSAAAKAYDAMAGIPYVGPVLGALAAAAAFAAIMAFGSFKEGGVLDQDMFMFGHAKEMVLPAGISTGLQGMIANGGAGAGGGNKTQLTYAPTMIGGEQWMKKTMSQHSDHMVKLIRGKMRKGALPGYGY